MVSAYCIVCCAYLGWRVTIIHTDYLALSIAYFCAELIGFILGLAMIISSRTAFTPIATKPKREYSIDIFVPVYKEPLHIIRRTLMAARDIDYPHRTFVLDDGKRTEIKILAEELGVEYYRRDGNQYAKAGNLNFGLHFSQADLIMVFDADHIAMPHAIDKLIGHFNDDAVAMVQTPQDYYNIESFPYMNNKNSGALWYDQSLFYNVVQPCGEAFNASTCVGTGVIYRRAALDTIGGFPVDTITEDFHTSIKFHKIKLKTIFVNEAVAYGVAASDLDEYYITRHRWTHGNLHAAVVENVLFSKDLTIKQRFHYACTLSQFLEGWQQIILLLIPIITLITGYQPFEITVLNVLIVMFFPFVSYALLSQISQGFSRFWAGELFAMVRWPIYLKSTLALFNYKLAWKSSTKTIRGYFNWRLVIPQITMASLSVIAVIIGIWRLDGHYEGGPLFQYLFNFFSNNPSINTIGLTSKLNHGYTMDLVMVAGGWALYNLFRVFSLIRKSVHHARNSHNFYHFRLSFPFKLECSEGRGAYTTMVAEDWVEIKLYDASLSLQTDHVLKGKILLPTGWLALRFSPQSIINGTLTAKILWGGHDDYNADYNRDILAATLYSIGWHRELIPPTTFFPTFLDGLRETAKSWYAFSYSDDQQVAMVGYDGRNTPFSIITFKAHSKGEILSGTLFSKDKSEHLSLIITKDKAPLISNNSGLGGIKWFRYDVECG